MLARHLSAILLVMAVSASAFAQQAPPADRYAGAPLSERLFFSGGIGLAFGDVDYVTVAPAVGLRVTERLSTGVGLFYQYRKDSRFSPDLKTNDFGASLFARYSVVQPLFLTGEVEYLNYERLLPGFTTERDHLTSVLGGAGIYQPLGRNAAGYVAVLYNFTYDDDFGDPYDSPWIYRAGIEIGF